MGGMGRGGSNTERNKTVQIKLWSCRIKTKKNQGRVTAQFCFHFVFQVSGVFLWISGCEFIFRSFLQLGNCSLQGVNPQGVKPCCVQKENLYRDFFSAPKSSYSTF